MYGIFLWCNIMAISKMVIMLIVAVVIVAIVIFYMNSQSSGSTSLTSYDNVNVNPSFITELSTIANNRTLSKDIGNGIASNLPSQKSPYTLLQVNEKPEVLYIGADYCPFCAITRWGLILALMRFGNFTALHYMTSSSSDAYPSTPTFTFYNSEYSSSLINFTHVELQTNVFDANISNYPKLQNLTSFESSTFAKFNRGGSIPFIDFGNYSIQVGALTTPQLIDNMNWSTIESDLNNPNTAQAQAIIGTADVFTAQICTILNNSAPACK